MDAKQIAMDKQKKGKIALTNNFPSPYPLSLWLLYLDLK